MEEETHPCPYQAPEIPGVQQFGIRSRDRGRRRVAPGWGWAAGRLPHTIVLLCGCQMLLIMVRTRSIDELVSTQARRTLPPAHPPFCLLTGTVSFSKGSSGFQSRGGRAPRPPAVLLAKLPWRAMVGSTV